MLQTLARRETRETTEVITTLAGLAELEDAWNALADRAGSPMVRHEWMMAVLRVFRAQPPWMALCLRSGERLRAACILTPRRSGFASFYEAVGVRHLGEWGGLLYESPEALRDILREMISLDRAVVLERLPWDPVLDLVLREFDPGATLLFNRETSAAYRLEIAGEWEDYHATLPASRRKELRRKRRRAEKLGGLDFRVIASDEFSCGIAFDQFARIEHDSPKGLDGRSICSNPDLCAFFRDVAWGFSTTGLFRFFVLEIGGEAAAVQMAVEHEGTLWALKIAYDPAFARCSPGLLLDREVLKYCFDKGLKAYEFLGKAEPWETFWKPEKRTFRSLYLFPLSARGLAGLMLRGTLSLGRRIGIDSQAA